MEDFAQTSLPQNISLKSTLSLLTTLALVWSSMTVSYVLFFVCFFHSAFRLFFSLLPLLADVRRTKRKARRNAERTIRSLLHLHCCLLDSFVFDRQLFCRSQNEAKHGKGLVGFCSPLACPLTSSCVLSFIIV
jgi:hypothetical protein